MRNPYEGGSPDTDLTIRRACAAEWIVRSWEASGRTGLAGYYSGVQYVLRNSKWAAPYPETTGYIIPTLIAYEHLSGEKKYADIACQMAEWLLCLQYPDGAFPGGYYRGQDLRPRSSFNTGQIIKGLLAAYEYSGSAKCLEAALRAAEWLTETQDKDGGWRVNALYPGFSPSYYTEVCWPMLSVYKATGVDRIGDAAVRGLQFIRSRQQANGVISCWGFKPYAKAFTHTIGYAIRGMLESGLILKDAGKAFWDSGYSAAEALERIQANSGILAGRYSEEWNPSSWFVCLTGNCQLALCWNTIYKETGEQKFASAARSALNEVMARQFMPEGWHENKGGIAGSKPAWGAYMKFRYPNWAAKYYLDALMEISATSLESNDQRGRAVQMSASDGALSSLEEL